MKKKFCICTILILAAVMNVAAMEKPFDEPWRLPQQIEGFSADDAENVELVGITPGTCYAVAVDGNTAYIGAGVYLLILNLTDKSAPALLGAVQLPDIVYAVAVSGGYAYIVYYHSGFGVVDVSNPASANEVGFYDTPDSAKDIAISGGYAYIAARSGGLRVVDISNPASPNEVGFCDTPAMTAYGVVVSGGYAYIADSYSGIHVVNVSNPENPYEVGFYQTYGQAWDVAVSGGYAYIADGSSGLRIIDVSNPGNPYETGFYDTPGGAGDVAVSGGYAYIADDYNGLRIVDVSNPENPYETGFYDTPGRALKVAVSGGYAYIADFDSGLRVVDISNPRNPYETGFYDTPEETRSVAVSGSYAYITGWYGGLRIVDVSNPENPYETGFYDTPGPGWDVAVSDGYAYTVNESSGLRVVDVSNPENPYETGFYQTPGNALGIAVVNNLIYVADAEGGMSILRYTGVDAGTITLDTSGPPTWSYILTRNSGVVSQWSYTGAGITGANVTGSAAAAGWIVLSQTATEVVFTAGTPLTSGSLSGFEISGTTAGMGTWTCHANSGSIEGALPVEVSTFTATVSSDGVTLCWRTESEVNNLGFNLYRSEQRNGEYVKMNSAHIKGVGTDATPHNYQFVDETVEDGKTYYYYLQDVDFHGNTHKSALIKVTVNHQTQPFKKSQPPFFALFQNYPNPFNPETWIPYRLATDSPVMISIYNAEGQLVRTISLGNKPAGFYVTKESAAYWNGRDSLGENVVSGVYYYTLQAGEFTATRKMVIVK